MSPDEFAAGVRTEVGNMPNPDLPNETYEQTRPVILI